MKEASLTESEESEADPGPSRLEPKKRDVDQPEPETVGEGESSTTEAWDGPLAITITRSTQANELDVLYHGTRGIRLGEDWVKAGPQYLTSRGLSVDFQ